jgi:hypothetical protein
MRFDWLVVYLTTLFLVTRLDSFDDRVIGLSKCWIKKDLVRSGHGLILRYYLGICLEGRRKTPKTSIRITGRRGRKSNPWTPEFEVGVLTTRPWRMVVWFRGEGAIFSYWGTCTLPCGNVLPTIPYEPLPPSSGWRSSMTDMSYQLLLLKLGYTRDHSNICLYGIQTLTSALSISQTIHE